MAYNVTITDTAGGTASIEGGSRGARGPAGPAVTDASLLTTGTLPDSRLSFTVSDFAKTLIDDADASTARTTLGAQASDATLTSLSGLSLAAGDVLYATAADTLARLPKGTAAQVLAMNAGATAPEWIAPSGVATTNASLLTSGTLPDARLSFTVSAFAKTLLDDADAADMQTTLGAQTSDATLTSLSGLSLAAGDVLYATAADTLARLPKGTAAQVLAMNAGATAPEWATSTAQTNAINLEGAIEHAVSFTVGAPDLSILHVLTPATGTTLQVTLPPATSHVGKAIAFLVPRNTSGLVQFLATPGQPASLIADYNTDDFWIWNGETVTLFAHSGVWQIADWRKNKLHIEVSMPATNIALTAGVSAELSGWVAPAWDATHLRHYKFALDGGAPQKIVLPRRGLWEVEVEAFVTFSGTAPTYLWMDLSGPAGFGAIANRRYADFIQTATPTQAVLHYRGRVSQNAKGTVIAPWIQIGGTPTSPTIAAVSSPPRMRLTEVS